MKKVFLVGHLYLEKEKSVGSSFLKLTGNFGNMKKGE